jgi:hypothetical protein
MNEGARYPILFRHHVPAGGRRVYFVHVDRPIELEEFTIASWAAPWFQVTALRIDARLVLGPCMAQLVEPTSKHRRELIAPRSRARSDERVSLEVENLDCCAHELFASLVARELEYVADRPEAPTRACFSQEDERANY